jgi:hypothetical protein
LEQRIESIETENKQKANTPAFAPTDDLQLQELEFRISSMEIENKLKIKNKRPPVAALDEVQLHELEYRLQTIEIENK